MTLDIVHVGNALDYPGSPLSAACRIGDTVHTAGILPIDPDSGDVVGDDIETQARQTLNNLVALLEKSGSSLDRVAIVRVYLTDIANDLAAFNKVYAEFFSEHHPARYALGVALAWPNLKVELQAVAAC